jgi:hypothetical protein
MEGKYFEQKESKRDCALDYYGLRKTLHNYTEEINELTASSSLDHDTVLHHMRYYMGIRRVSRYWMMAHFIAFLTACTDYIRSLSIDDYYDFEFLYKLQLGPNWMPLTESIYDWL